MASFPLPDDWVLTLPIIAKTADDTLSLIPAGDSFTFTTSDPGVQAVMGTTAAGAPAVVINRLVRGTVDVTVTANDSAGLSPATIVLTAQAAGGGVATQLAFDIPNASHTTQAVPSS